MRSILFVSTVNSWAGSEIMWTEIAASLAEKGYDITFAIRYKNPVIQKLVVKGGTYIDLSRIESVQERVLRKLNLKKHPFIKVLKNKKPPLVFINVGNNVHGNYYLTSCSRAGIPYVTMTHLIPILLWAFINDEEINEIRKNYQQSQQNYFVSRANLRQHNIMLGDEHPNSKIVLNPFTVPQQVTDEYPPVIDGHYQIAMVGRLETFHKGHDLLLQVISQAKWKDRPVTFNIFGTGPHLKLLERLLKKYEITNVVFKGYEQEVINIWKNNHLLIMPSRMEGQSLALIEAMWCFRGAVVTDVGGAKELITDGVTGFVADYPAISDVDNALEKAWHLRDKWEAIGRNAGRKIREIYQEDPVENFTKEIQSVYDKINSDLK